MLALLPALNAALALAEELMPIVQQQIKAGMISPEEQQKVRDKFNSLRQAAAFEGPEWEVPPEAPGSPS
jgi:hypothetical protein